MDKITVLCPACHEPFTTYAFCIHLRHQCPCGSFFTLACTGNQWIARPVMTPEELSRQGGGWKTKYQQKGLTQ